MNLIKNKKFRKLLTPAIIIIVIFLAYYLYKSFSTSSDLINFRTDTLKKGLLTEVIVSTGTIEPEELVDVGTQVGGMIASFGKDTRGREIDYGSEVKAGMVLATIDDALYVADLKQAQAQLQQGKASLANANASVKQQQAQLHLAERNWERSKAMFPRNIISQADHDMAASELEKAEANLTASEALIVQAEASIATAQASLDRAERNLGYCVITSPVDGIIIDRRVNVGQTVVSSMSTPSLFLIAKDLRRMQIWVSVNEADIGRIAKGQEVVFTVDAFPGETFTGEVEKIRLNASMSQNVVSYIVEVYTDNSSGRLLPYLTANVSFILKRTPSEALSVPNAALRYKPDAKLIAPEYQEYLEKSGVVVDGKGVIWLNREQVLTPIEVTVGVNDGSRTEVEAPDIAENESVITGVLVGDVATAGGSPFMPQMPKRSRRR